MCPASRTRCAVRTGLGAQGPPTCAAGPRTRCLHRVVREHLETFLAETRLRGGGEGLPGRGRKWRTGNRKRKREMDNESEATVE